VSKRWTSNSEDLLARKRQHMDPVVERLAPGFGAIASVTSKTASGIITVNLWATAEGAAAFSQLSRHPGCRCLPHSSASPTPSTGCTARNEPTVPAMPTANRTSRGGSGN